MVMIAVPAFAEAAAAASSSSSPSSPSPSASSSLDESVSTRTQDYITSRGLLISAADAVERIMSSWRHIAELAGRTARIADMIDIFKQVQQGRYYKKQAVDDSATTVPATAASSDQLQIDSSPNSPSSGLPEADELERKRSDSDASRDETLKQITPSGSVKGLNEIGKGKLIASKPASTSSSSSQQPSSKCSASASLLPLPSPSALPKPLGVVIDNSPCISLTNVPILTPNGDALIRPPGLSFTIEPGMHLLISGPNGCGKSSLFRLIGGIWPVPAGVLRKPAPHHLFYIPQRPYLTRSSLRDQFLYPHTSADMEARGMTDEELMAMMEVVQLRRVVQRVGGLDKVDDWQDVLSGGEKQRVAMGRMFYHRPRFAILDECTSAVSLDVEGAIYASAKAAGISLLTVTHRPSLWKYHTHLLQFDGQGGYRFGGLDAEARLSLQEEKAKIEQQLAGAPAAQARLRELCGMLGDKSIYAQEEGGAAAEKGEKGKKAGAAEEAPTTP